MPDDDINDLFDPAAKPRRGNYDDIIQKHAQRTGLDPALIKAVMGQESGGNPNAISPKGATGPMQLMPATARRFGVTNPRDPEQAIRGGTDYLKFLNDRYGGNRDLVLAGYNAGEGAVDKYGGVPPYRETRNYVKSINAKLGQQQHPTSTPDSLGDLFDQPSRQTAPPPNQTNEARVTPSPAANAAATQPQPRQPSVPSLTAPGVNAAAPMGPRNIPRGLLLPRGQRNAGVAGAPILPTPQTSNEVPLQLPTVNKNLGALPSEMVQAANSPAAQEREQMRQQVAQARASRVGAYGAPTRAGVAQLLTHPLTTLGELAQPESQNAENEVQSQMDAVRQQRRPEVEALAKTYRGIIRSAAQTGQLGPDVQQWANEVVGQSAPLAEYAAAGIRGLSPLTAITAQLLGRREKDADAIALHAAAIAQAAEEEGADRSTASQIAQHAISGLAVSAPEMGAMAAGIPPIAAFAGGAATRAFGRGESPTQIAEAGTQAALQAAPFELPVSQGLGGVKGALARGGSVGAGTAAIGLAQGQTPSQAAASGLQMGIMAGAPEVGRESPRRAAIRGRLGELQAEAEAPSGEPPPTETPQRYYHSDLGEVTTSPDQKGVWRRRVRVIDSDGGTHIIKRSDLSGRGNQRAVPIREPSTPSEGAPPQTTATEAAAPVTAFAADPATALKQAFQLPLVTADELSNRQRGQLAKPMSITYESESGREITRTTTVEKRLNELSKKQDLLNRLVDCLHA